MNGEIYFDKNGDWRIKPLNKKDQKRKNALEELQNYYNIACSAYEKIYSSLRGEGEPVIKRFKFSNNRSKSDSNKKASDMAQCIENFLKFIIYYYDYNNDVFIDSKKIQKQINLKLRELFKDQDKIDDYKTRFGVSEDYIKDVFNNHHIHYIFTEFIPENVQVLIKYKLLTCATTGANKPSLYNNEDIILLTDKEKYHIVYDIATLEKVLFDNQNAGVSGRYPTPVLFDEEGLRRVMDAVVLVTEYLTTDFDYNRKESIIEGITIKNYSIQLEKVIQEHADKNTMLEDLVKLGIYEEHLTKLTEFELYTLIKDFTIEEVREIIDVYESNNYDIEYKNCYCFISLLIFLKNASNQSSRSKVTDPKITYDTETINRLYTYYEKISSNTLFMEEIHEKTSLKDQIRQKISKEEGISVEKYSYMLDYIEQGNIDKSSSSIIVEYINKSQQGKWASNIKNKMDSESKITVDDKINMLMDFYNKHQRWPSASSGNNEERSLRFFLNNIRHCREILTEEQKQKLLSMDKNIFKTQKEIAIEIELKELINYYKNYGKWPTKREMTGMVRVYKFLENLTPEQKQQMLELDPNAFGGASIKKEKVTSIENLKDKEKIGRNKKKR